jgi:hypothetical protein
MRERVVVVLPAWEHDCCGPEIERGTRAHFTAAPVRVGRFVESRHHEDATGLVELRGVVDELRAVTGAGPLDVHRIPSGRALRGVDEYDDGHLEVPWTGERLDTDTDDVLRWEVVLDVHVPGGERAQ